VKLSVIVSIYKRPGALALVLASLARQTRAPDEVIVTEDGRAAENAAVVAEFQSRFQSLRHLTQDDIGNRKPLALNKAILASNGDYLVFVDGDCVLRADFVAAHAAFKEEAAFLTGRRVELSAKATARLTLARVERGYLDGHPWWLYWDALRGRSQSLGRFFRTPGPLRKLLRQDEILDIRGCNFSVHRAPIVAINGFSNNFSGAYGEDSDVEYRLKFHGLRMKSVKGAAIQFHLWHATQAKDLGNQSRLQELLVKGAARAENGLNEAASIA